MKVYLGFDDTDTLASPNGTGKLVRWFQNALPAGCRCLGVVRQQLLVCDRIPYTSHNSAACMIVDIPEPAAVNRLIEGAVDHLVQHAASGSDPGVCVATEADPAIQGLVAFGQACTRTVATQGQALAAAGKTHLSGHGGTNDGIIGAAAAVGLTISGWSGRFIEFGDLRGLPGEVAVSDLNQMGIQVVAVDRDAAMPAPDDKVVTNGWLRPRLLGHCPVLMVVTQSPGVWRNIHCKRRKAEHQEVSGTAGLCN